MQVHELEGVGVLRKALEASRTRGFSRFMSRDAELSILEAAARAIAGTGQVVGVVAAPCVKKSRFRTEHSP